MGLKPGYKKTEVGVIPEEWEILPLGKLAQIERGKFTARPRNDPRYYGGDIPFIQTGDVTNSEGSIATYSQTLNAEGLKVSKLFPRGTLFFTIAANIGDVGFAEFDTACPDSLVAITPKKNFDRKWLAYELASRKRAFENIATDNAQLNINLEKLKPYRLPVPLAAEQRAIAEALSDVDALIGALDRLIAKKRDLKQAAMQQLLTGQKRLPGFSGEWEVKRLGDVLTRVVNGAVYRPTNSLGLPITRIETISDGTIDLERIGYAEATPELTKYKLERGDILFSHINSVDHIGKVAIFRGETDLYHGMNLLLLRAGAGIDSAYLFYWLGSRQGRQRSVSLAKQAVSQASINTSELKGIELRLPPFSEQTAIAEVLSDMDAEIAALERRRDKTRALKQGMMQELLTGRTRLVR